MELLIITGPPYSGKGTQCELLQKELGYTHVSTGDLCRTEKEKDTAVGKVLAEYEVKGDLVPDEIMKELFSMALDQLQGEEGVILDGYPRTQPQVEDLLALVAEKGLLIEKVLNIDVPAEELLKRAKKRAENSTREDDKDPETHIKRIVVFESVTRPAIDYMKDRLEVLTFDGTGTIEETSAKIKSVL